MIKEIIAWIIVFNVIPCICGVASSFVEDNFIKGYRFGWVLTIIALIFVSALMFSIPIITKSFE